jgi:hypothetical protein
MRDPRRGVCGEKVIFFQDLGHRYRVGRTTPSNHGHPTNNPRMRIPVLSPFRMTENPVTLLCSCVVLCCVVLCVVPLFRVGPMSASYFIDLI